MSYSSAASSKPVIVNVIQVSAAEGELITSLLWAPGQEDNLASVTTSFTFQVSASAHAALSTVCTAVSTLAQHTPCSANVSLSGTAAFTHVH
jgi:hypothetical protein